MHPLPRVYEIHTDVNADPRACNFREMENGMYDEWHIVPCLTWKTVNAWYVREKTNLVNKLIFLNLIYRIYTQPTVHLDILNIVG
jgi:hypothetical protein